MSRPVRDEELRLWRIVTNTIHPLAGRAVEPTRPAPDAIPRIRPQAAGPAARAPEAALAAADPIEPRRRHRIVRERDQIGGRIDLHGMTQDRAHAALEAFLRRSWENGCRAVLVITGKGVQGDGVLRRRVPDWLGAPAFSHIVAGISEAHRRHGGEGAVYVALKRRPRP